MTTWIRFEIGAIRSRKIALLPSDGARWAWWATVAAAKEQRPSGQFANEQHLQACVTPTVASEFTTLLGAGLLEVAPDLCSRCIMGFNVPDGTIVIHDWHSYQLDPTGTERSRRARARAIAPEPESGGYNYPRQLTNVSPEAPGTPVEKASTEKTTYGQAIDWIEKKTNREWFVSSPNSALWRALRDIVDLHGIEKVLLTFESLSRDHVSLVRAEQFVYGAQRVLEPIPSVRAAKNLTAGSLEGHAHDVYDKLG